MFDRFAAQVETADPGDVQRRGPRVKEDRRGKNDTAV
jgi:hypothetical protein